VVELAGDLVLGLHLLDEAEVLLLGAHDVLEGEDFLRARIDDGVDGASRTLSQPLQNFIVEEFLGHERSCPHQSDCTAPDPGGGTRAGLDASGGR
jgi:hypothetical protein